MICDFHKSIWYLSIQFNLLFKFAANIMTKKIEHNQSKSLWNYTLSPGWKPE
jgi:hypothetical protein